MSAGQQNHASEADYLATVGGAYNPPASLLDGAPSTGNALSRYQWNMRQLLEGEPYDSLYADAPTDVLVAVIGGGWPCHRNHPSLVNRFVPGLNFVEGGTNTTTTWDGGAGNGNAHDQGVASIIAAEHGSGGMAGVFHRAKIMPIRASFQTLGAAVDAAVSAGAKVIHVAGIVTASYDEQYMFMLDNNWPAGYPTYPSFRSNAGRDALLPAMKNMRRAIEGAAEAGVVVTTVTANWGGAPTWTLIANMSETIVAGPSNVLGELSPHSSFSFAHDIYAPGGDRRAHTPAIAYPSSVISGDYASNGDDPMVCVGPDKYSFLTLGSAAGPHVAGACAIIKSYLPNASVEEVRRLLRKASRTPTPTLNILQATGGLLSLKKLRELLPTP